MQHADLLKDVERSGFRSLNKRLAERLRFYPDRSCEEWYVLTPSQLGWARIAIDFADNRCKTCEWCSPWASSQDVRWQTGVKGEKTLQSTERVRMRLAQHCPACFSKPADVVQSHATASSCPPSWSCATIYIACDTWYPGSRSGSCAGLLAHLSPDVRLLSIDESTWSERP
jgi:hypothetical protein